MNMKVLLSALACSLGLAVFVSPARCQSAGRYDWSGFEINLDDALKKHLQDSLLKHVKEEWNLPVDPELWNLEISKEQMKLFEQMLQQKLKGMDASKQTKLKEDWSSLKKLFDSTAKNEHTPPTPPKKKNAFIPDRNEQLGTRIKPPKPTAKPVDEEFTRWAKDQLEWMQETEVGELLRDSPAFQQTVRDFQRQLLERGGEQDWRWQDWINDMRLPKWEGKPPEFLNRLPEWTPPELPRPNIRLPRLPGFRGGLPSFSTPRMSVPSAGALGESILWIVLFAGCGFIAWQLIKRSGIAGTNDKPRLGPWPLDPRNIRTPAELIAAFEYLSLLRLGSSARHWNHVLIVENLAAANTPQRRDAAALAALYAQARYAPESLGEAQVAAARAPLCSLAGVA